MAASKSTRPADSGTRSGKRNVPHTKPPKWAWQAPRTLSAPAYEHLYLLNLYAQNMVDLLNATEGKYGLRKEMAAYCRAVVQEVCSLASQDILEFMNEIEISNAVLYARLRERYEAGP
jgi:hypothetical protein